MTAASLPPPSAAEWSLWSTTARLVVTDPDALPHARTLMDGYLQLVDDAANRFRPDSELSRLPSTGGYVEISPMLRDLLAQALWAAEVTDGIVDPTVGALLERLGYDRDLELIEEQGALVLAVVRAVPRWGSISLQGRTLWLAAGTRLDLGATAKACAADRAAAMVAETLGTGVLVSLGGDIATAGPAPESGWQIRVQDQPTDPVTQVALPAGAAIATSSTVARTWRRNGRQLHHIVDPRTGEPAAPFWRSVTVSAACCVEANAVSTACVIRGECAPDWVEEIGLPARFLRHDGELLTTTGWPTQTS